jgi:hypothetical protein
MQRRDPSRAWASEGHLEGLVVALLGEVGFVLGVIVVWIGEHRV